MIAIKFIKLYKQWTLLLYFNLYFENKPGHSVVCRHRGWICLWNRVAALFHQYSMTTETCWAQDSSFHKRTSSSLVLPIPSSLSESSDEFLWWILILKFKYLHSWRLVLEANPCIPRSRRKSAPKPQSLSIKALSLVQALANTTLHPDTWLWPVANVLFGNCMQI